MTSRKRRQRSDSDISTPRPSKRRARAQSGLARADRALVDDALPPHEGSAEQYWEIKDIIEEKGRQYLIDWKGIDPKTGKGYEPTWEPKRNVTAAAVAAWERRKLERGESKAKRIQDTERISSPALGRTSSATPTKRPRARRRARRQAVVDTSSPSLFITPPPQLAPPAPVNPREEHQVQESEVGESQEPTLPVLELPQIAIEISQHSSFPRDQYILYQSSQSAPGLSSSQLQHQDSGIGESSPPPELPAPTAFGENGIVPDSQALTDSSGFVPTSSKSVDISGATDTAGIERGRTPLAASTHTVIESSNAPVAESSDHIEDPTYPVTPYNPQSKLDTHRSTSTPPQQLKEYSLISIAEASQAIGSKSFSRARSDPGPVIQQGLETPPPVLEPSTSSAASQIKASQAGQVISTHPTEIDSLSLESTSNLAVEDSPPEAQVSRSVEHHSPEKSLDLCSSGQELVFQTQVPLVLDSQISNQIHTPLSTIEDNWQSGQLVRKDAQPASQISLSEKEHKSRSKSPQTPEVKAEAPSPQIVSEESIATLSTADPELKNPQKPLENGHVPTATENLILSQRDPNSLSEKAHHPEGSKEEIILETIESPGLTTENVSSSLAASGPSHLPETFASGAPPRPPTPSDNEMSDLPQSMASPAPKISHPTTIPTAPGGMSLKEKLRNMRASSAASMAAKRAKEATQSARTTKSPSIIPEKAPHQEIGDDRLEVQSLDIPMVLRSSLNDQHAPLQPSKLAIHREMSEQNVVTTLETPRLDKMEFIVPLPMNTRVRDQYVSTIHYYRQAIERFMLDDHPSRELLDLMQTMIHRVHRVTVHIDLENNGALTQQDVSPEEEATWAENCSSKFQFLRHFFGAAHQQDKHVAILAQPGRSLDIIENFLKGRHVRYNRPDALSISDPSTAKGLMQVSLIATGNEGATTVPRGADVIIAFDSSFNARDPQVKTLRAHVVNASQMSPVVHLIVYSSAEHINRCLPTSLSSSERLKALVRCVTETRREVGILLPDEAGPAAAAEEVAAFIEAGGMEGQWALPSIRGIEGVQVIESSQNLGSSTQSETQHDITASPASLKRPLDLRSEGTSTPKKQRMTPTADVTHISDSVSEVSQTTIASLRAALHKAEIELTNLKASHAYRENHLGTIIETGKQQLQDHVTALGELQTRYEKRSATVHELRHENTNLKAAVAAATRKQEAQALEVSDWKQEKARLEEQLETARAALTESSIPEIAETETAKAAARLLSQDKTALENKVRALTTDFEFTRHQYQVASAAAAASATALAALEAEALTLRQKSAGVALQLRDKTAHDESEAHRQRVLFLEHTLRERNELLRRKEEELRDVRRGRGMGGNTRASSLQPRSPRGAGAAVVGSRASSPVPGVFGVGMGGPAGAKVGSALRFG